MSAYENAYFGGKQQKVSLCEYYIDNKLYRNTVLAGDRKTINSYFKTISQEMIYNQIGVINAKKVNFKKDGSQKNKDELETAQRIFKRTSSYIIHKGKK